MALNHNFQKGVDWVADPTGATALVNHVFVSQSPAASDLNTGTLAAPYRTINAARTAQGSARTYIVGTGEYIPENLVGGTYRADGVVVLNDAANTKRLSSGIDPLFDGFVIKGYLNVLQGSGNRGVNLSNCLVLNTNLNYGGTGVNITFQNTIFINCVLTQSSNSCVIRRSMLFNCIVNSNSTSGSEFTSCHIDDTCIISFNNSGAKVFNYNNNNGLLNGNPPTSNIGNINLPPLFLGNPFRFEFVINRASPLIGAGELGSVIGNAKFGNIQNSTSLEFGTSPADNTNMVFNGFNLEKINPALQGVRTTTTIDLGKLYNSPRIVLNALSDYINNVPNSQQIANPNQLNVQISYAGNNQVFTAYKSFKLNERIYLDGSGNSTSDIAFNWANLVVQQFRYVRVRVIMPPTYVN